MAMSPQPLLVLAVGLTLPLAGAVLLVLAVFVPWLRVQYGRADTLGSYSAGSSIATSHLTNVSLDGLPIWLTLVYVALLAGLAIAGLRVAATGWDTPTATAKRLLLVSGLATLLMLHELFSFISDLLAVDSIRGSGLYSDRFNPGPSLFVGPLGALLALVGALVALGWAKRSARASAWLPVADSSAELAPAFVHGLLPRGAWDATRGLVSRWCTVLTRPTRASFEPVVVGAGWGGAIANVGALVGAQTLAGLLCGTLSLGDLAQAIVMTPVGFFLLAGALFLVARGLGGDGELAAHMHVVAVGWAPAAALASVALAVGVPVVSGVAGVALGGYGVYLAVVAMLAVHRLGGRQAPNHASLATATDQPMPPQSEQPQPWVPEQASTPLLPLTDAAPDAPDIQGTSLPQSLASYVCAAGHPVDDASAQLCPLCGAAVQSALLNGMTLSSRYDPAPSSGGASSVPLAGVDADGGAGG